MKQEKSCGAVVYRKNKGTIEYLIEKMRQGHYALCKGHVEDNETEHETARREIKEETGLDVSFTGDFRSSTGYSPAEGIYKEVIYFLAEAVSSNQKVQLSEVSDIIWLPYSKALSRITYESDREILRKANDYLKEIL